MITADQVATYLGLPATADQAVVEQATASANAYVARLGWLVDPYADPPRDQTDAPDVVDGTIKLAARLYRRRNTPSGIESFGDAGAAYVARGDPEIRMLLRLSTPMVG
jgi:hypothetical protein